MLVTKSDKFINLKIAYDFQEKKEVIIGLVKTGNDYSWRKLKYKYQVRWRELRENVDLEFFK